MKISPCHIPYLAVSLILLTGVPVTFSAPGDIEKSFSIPCKYPAGLASNGEHLFVADWREAVIFEILPTDGKLVRKFAAPTLKPTGLAWGAGRIFVSDDHTGYVYAVDPATGTVETAFEAPTTRATGLAFAEGTLYILADHRIYHVLPDDGTILGYFDAPNRNARHLSFDGTFLWVSNRVKDEIYMVEPDEGRVIGILKAPGPYATGIACEHGHLWNVDFQKRAAYRLAVASPPLYQLSEPRRARVEYLWALNNYGPGTVTELSVNLALPMELPGQKLLSDVAYSTSPTNTGYDRWGQQCATFDLGPVSAGSKAILTAAVDAEISAIRYLILPDRTGTLDDIPAAIRERYTADGTRYRISTPYMQDLAKRIVGDERNPYWIARKIFDYVIGSLEYEMIGGWDIPEVVLKRGSGSCSEYTYSFVALCRAAGLPARYQGSIVARGDDASIDEAFHRWAQVYLPNYGWVPVDANRGDAKSPADQARGFGELSNRFLITTQGGGDSEYLSWGYNLHAHYKTDGYCKIEQDNFGFWEPLEDEAAASSTDASAAPQRSAARSSGS